MAVAEMAAAVTAAEMAAAVTAEAATAAAQPVEHLNVNKHEQLMDITQRTVASCTQIKRGRTRPLRSDYLTRHTGGCTSYSGRGVPASTTHTQRWQRMILSMILQEKGIVSSPSRSEHT